MGLTYVIPDIHGRCDLLSEGLAEIAAHAGGKAGLIITIGDYVDKGPQSKEVLIACCQALPTAGVRSH
jgi:serine/threonine protein phosphatase 1